MPFYVLHVSSLGMTKAKHTFRFTLLRWLQMSKRKHVWLYKERIIVKMLRNYTHFYVIIRCENTILL